MTKAQSHVYGVYIRVPFRKQQGLCALLPLGLFEENLFVLLTQIAKYHIKKSFFLIDYQIQSCPETFREFVVKLQN